MRILIIEDNEYKYENVKKILNKLLGNSIIEWEKSRNSGLCAIRNHNFKENEFEPYDVIICDNYMPIYDDEMMIEPFGADIIREVRKRFKLVNLPIIICSSEEIEDCDYNYMVKYDCSVCMDDKFKNIFDDLLSHDEYLDQSLDNIIKVKKI